MNVTWSCSQIELELCRPFSSSRFDKSVEGILNGRNAAMFVAIEAKKRGWNLEFEEVQYLMDDDR